MKYLKTVGFVLGVGVVFLRPAFGAANPNFQFHDYTEEGTSTPKENPPTAVTPVSTAAPVNDPSTSDPKGMVTETATAAPPPPMRVNTTIRPIYGIGTSVTLYGGVTPFQDGTLRITSPSAPGAEIKGDTRDEIGGVAGIKVGYTWPSFDAIGASNDAASPIAPGLFEPSISGDFFWTGYRYKAVGSGTTGSGGVTGTYNGTLRADADTYTFCLEPTIKLNLGAFRPYAGFGVGGTYVNASNANVSGNASVLNATLTGSQNLTGSSSDFDFTAEGLAGMEYFFAEHWALDFDYKFVYLLNPAFHGDYSGVTINYHLPGLGEHLFTAGVSFYF